MVLSSLHATPASAWWYGGGGWGYSDGYPHEYGSHENPFGYAVPFADPTYPLTFGFGFGGDDWGKDDDD